MCSRIYDEDPDEAKLRQQTQKLTGRIGSGKYSGDKLQALREERDALISQMRHLKTFNSHSSSEQ